MLILYRRFSKMQDPIEKVIGLFIFYGAFSFIRSFEMILSASSFFAVTLTNANALPTGGHSYATNGTILPFGNGHQQ